MTMSLWSAVVQHIATRRIVAELPIESAKASAIRNAPGSLNVSIPLASTVGLRPVDVEERRNAIILRRDDPGAGPSLTEETQYSRPGLTSNIYKVFAIPGTLPSSSPTLSWSASSVFAITFGFNFKGTP